MTDGQLSMFTPVEEMFTGDELEDITTAAEERGISVHELVHDAVMNDLYR